MLRSFRGVSPKADPSAYIDPSAQVIGDVVIGERSSVWANATIRGDVNIIRIGNESNIQDNCVLHVDEGLFPMHIGDRVTVGHSVVLHGCTIEDDALIGIGAVILNGARIGKGAVIAAGAVVSEGAMVAPGMLIMGVPGRPKRDVTPEEQARFGEGVRHYVELAKEYREQS